MSDEALQPVAADPNAAPSVESSSTADMPSSAPTASPESDASPSAASSAEPFAETAAVPVLTEIVPAPAAPAAPETFEQRVESRFLALEKALMGLPHAIATANGHPDSESWAHCVIHNLFGVDNEPKA